VIIGAPDEVVEQLTTVATDLNVGHLMMLLQFGSMGKELAKDNTKLFSEKVMPRLRGLFSAWEDTWWPAPMAPSERAAPTPFHAPAIAAEEQKRHLPRPARLENKKRGGECDEIRARNCIAGGRLGSVP
jgi:hypothetical protein